MKKILTFAFLLAAGLFFSSCKSTEEEETFADYIEVSGVKYGINSVKYKDAGGLTVTLNSDRLFVRLFLSPSIVGKTIDLASLGRSETDYWIISTNITDDFTEQKADSRELIGGKPRTDKGTIKVNLDKTSRMMVVDMECALGVSYAIKVHFNGKAEPDMQDITIDE